MKAFEWTKTNKDGEGIACEKTIGSLKLKVISKTSERYPMIQFGPLRFQDTANFLKDKLDNLIKSQRKAHACLEEAFPRTAKLHPHASVDLDLLLRKIPFPYKAMVSHGSFAHPSLFPIGAYKNDMTGEACTEEEYALVNKVIGVFELKTFAEYHDTYLHTDVLALADGFEAFRATFFQEN